MMSDVIIIIATIAIMFIAALAGLARGKLDLETIERYANNGKEWCLEELALCTYEPRKVLIRSAIQRINREIQNDSNE